MEWEKSQNAKYKNNWDVSISSQSYIQDGLAFSEKA